MNTFRVVLCFLTLMACDPEVLSPDAATPASDAAAETADAGVDAATDAADSEDASLADDAGCVSASCPDDAGVSADAAMDAGCAPLSCAAAGAECGAIQDGCGGTLECGICDGSQRCDNNQCRCQLTTCAALGATCGRFDDGCGGTLQCGICTSPQTCGGGGTPNQCGCMPNSDAVICERAGVACGPASGLDNCGAFRRIANCGSCPALQTCGGGGVIGRCGCTPESDATLCRTAGRTCGTTTLIDSCGQSRSVTCGTCRPIAAGMNVCGSSGTCSAECNSGFHSCGTTCSSNTDVRSCGSSCTPCPSVANGRPTCDGTSCGMQCDEGSRQCATGCCRWVSERLASLTMWSARLAVDAAGQPHIVYYDFGQNHYRYASRVSGSWRSTRVGSSAVAPTQAISIDERGTIHVIAGNEYSTFDGTVWTEHAPLPRYGADVQLLLRGAEVLVAYRLPTSGDVYLARYEESGWQVELVETTGAATSRNYTLGATLTPSGQPALFYGARSSVRLAQRSASGSWTIDVVSPTNVLTERVAIQNISDGFAVSFWGEVYEGRPGSWRPSTAMTPFALQLARSPRVDEVRIVSLSQDPSGTYSLEAQTPAAGGWRREVIRSGVIGVNSAIWDAVVDSHGELWVLFSAQGVETLHH